MYQHKHNVYMKCKQLHCLMLVHILCLIAWILLYNIFLNYVYGHVKNNVVSMNYLHVLRTQHVMLILLIIMHLMKRNYANNLNNIEIEMNLIPEHCVVN